MKSFRRLTLLLFLLWLYPAPGAPSGELPPAEELRLEMHAAKTRLYLREPVSLTVTLLAGQLQLRDIRYPRIAGSSFALGEFGLPREREVVRDGVSYTAYAFATTLTPVKSGSLTLGPARIDCELLQPAGGSGAFFGETKARRVTLASPPVPLTVLPVPLDGRPKGYGGAVGSFTVELFATPRDPRAGDPVTVRTVIRGEGSAGQFSCREIAPPGFRSYPPRGKALGDTLTCEQVIVPESPSASVVPAVAISFFDPAGERFVTARSAPLTLRVGAPLPAAKKPPGRAPPPSAARGSAPPSPEAGFRIPIVPAALALLTAALAAGWLLLGGRRHPVPSPPGAGGNREERPGEWLAAARGAVEAADADAFYHAVFRAVQDLAAARLDVPAAGWSAPLPEGTLPAPLQGAAAALWERCGRVRYGREGADAPQMARDLDLLQQLLEGAGGAGRGGKSDDEGG